MNRFCRIEQLFGRPVLEKLQVARVAVFGLGAVGSYAVEALARAGIGYLRLVDCDVVRLSNFNRQLYALESTLNRPIMGMVQRFTVRRFTVGKFTIKIGNR